MKKSEPMKDDEYIYQLLMGINREGMKDLVQDMREYGFGTAPCSGGHHLCCEGGLAKHTRNVVDMSLTIAKTMLDPREFDDMKHSIILVACLHDIGKMGDFITQKPYYVKKILKSGKEPATPYEVNKDIEYKVPHAVLSVENTIMYIDLSEDERFAILTHDGLEDLQGLNRYILPQHETKLQQIVHFADMWCSRFVESKTLPEEGQA